MLMAQFRFWEGAAVPPHSHPHEQIGLLLKGRQRLTIGERTIEIEAGSTYVIPGGMLHSAVALAESEAIDVFSPPREDYFPVDEAGRLQTSRARLQAD